MDTVPCQVCGSTDLNLVDGYYYCVECGTQDANIRETLVDHSTAAPEGVILLSSTRKIPIKKKQKTDMSSEWHKWHTYNFILAGIADELIALGARPSFKKIVFWIWTRYIKRYQDKEEMGLNSDDEDEEPEDNDITEEERKKRKMAEQFEEASYKNFKLYSIKKSLILSIIYVALNYDKSHIQLADIYRFCREGRISLDDSAKFLPQDLNIALSHHWAVYRRSLSQFSKDYIRYIGMKIIRKLKLGPPFVPDLKRILNNYIIELCLPNEFKRLVLSLMHVLRCDFLEMDSRSQYCYSRIPDYETIIMSYIVIGLKMCFGLDSEYEFKLSDVVDRINNEECNMKSYRTGMFSNATERLFSFREWRDYLQLRKKILCKSYLPIAEHRNANVDDSVFIEQLDKAKDKRKATLPDEITMNILNKIPMQPLASVLPKATFPVTFTPLQTYTQVIIEHTQDPQLKMLLSEDFSQYSLKYACQDLKLIDGEENIIRGVSEERKQVSAERVTGTLEHLRGRKEEYELVYVRNCDNRNWMKTKRPTLDHITNIDETSGDRLSDHGYDSNTENVEVEKANPKVQAELPQEEDEEDRKLETIEPEDEDKNIFDDDFEDLDEKKKIDITKPLDDSNMVTVFEFNNSRYNRNKTVVEDSNRCNDNEIDDSKTDITFNSNTEPNTIFDPETFDREKIVRTLILAACKKYKIRTPQEYREMEPPKRIRKYKKKLEDNECGASEPKKLKRDVTKPGERIKEINDLLAAYYTNLENDVLHQVSEQIRTVVHDNAQQAESVSDRQSNINIVFQEDLNDTVNQDDQIEASHLDGQSIQIIQDESQVAIESTQDPALDTSVAPDLDLQFETNSVEANSDDEDIDLLPKIDPKFDEETHDVKQLYIKINKLDDDEDDIYDLTNDPEIEEILKKKLAETEFIPIEKTQEEKEIKSDSDDDLPLAVFQEEKLYYEIKRKQREEKLEYLIENRDDIKTFKYWMRHYDKYSINARNRTAKFDGEMKENLPISLNFIIQECCAILQCSNYTLYKSVQNMEMFLMSRFKTSVKL